MRTILITLLLLCFIPFTTKAQKLEFNGEFLLFREAKTKQPVVIINDSLVYKGFAMKRIAFKHTEYPAKLQEYKFFNIGAKTYLVHEGCGPVLEYRNDSIVRIDNSFLHRNQFGAVRFVYNNEIYFYGGYGLFTFKNILTKYDFQTREWIEVRTFSESTLETRESAFSYIIDNDLYVFGGNTNDETKTQIGKQLDNSIWKLHLPTMEWKLEGKINGISKDNISDCILFSQNKKKLYFLADVLNEIDLEKNTITKSDKLIFSSSSCYFEGKNFIGILPNQIKKIKYFTIIPTNRIKGKHLSSSKFITHLSFNNINILLLISVCSFLILLFIFRNRISSKLKPYSGIIYNQQSQLFLYKNKQISVFNEQEKKLLIYLMEHNNQFVSLNNLNQLFENNNQPETISATVKRREQAVSRLLTKISKMTGIEEEELILEQKNIEDKRIKDLKILPNLLKIV